ncbi:unnamed protein product [Aphis gossypii]|uniref:Uncharacterized protein n=1 Tax=Aphis gossypii TaxID=80765 RepID=A0A9P0NHR5_APHGO|nr:unnamed protein product [Aphis gossypii]
MCVCVCVLVVHASIRHHVDLLKNSLYLVATIFGEVLKVDEKNNCWIKPNIYKYSHLLPTYIIYKARAVQYTYIPPPQRVKYISIRIIYIRVPCGDLRPPSQFGPWNAFCNNVHTLSIARCGGDARRTHILVVRV